MKSLVLFLVLLFFAAKVEAIDGRWTSGAEIDQTTGREWSYASFHGKSEGRYHDFKYSPRIHLQCYWYKSNRGWGQLVSIQFGASYVVRSSRHGITTLDYRFDGDPQTLSVRRSDSGFAAQVGLGDQFRLLAQMLESDVIHYRLHGAFDSESYSVDLVAARDHLKFVLEACPWEEHAVEMSEMQKAPGLQIKDRGRKDMLIKSIEEKRQTGLHMYRMSQQTLERAVGGPLTSKTIDELEGIDSSISGVVVRYADYRSAIQKIRTKHKKASRCLNPYSNKTCSKRVIDHYYQEQRKIHDEFRDLGDLLDELPDTIRKRG